MLKITFLGAGSTVFARSVLGDVMCTPALRECEIALYDIDPVRLDESYRILSVINHNVNQDRAVIKTYLGVENRKDALRNARFVVNAVQIGGYEPCTVIDFEIPKKYGLKQTIADTLGIGGIMRALRTIPVMEEFARDMEEVCPDCLFLNYTNPMAMLTGYMLRYTSIKTVGLCHSVQVCSEHLLQRLGMEDKLELIRQAAARISEEMAALNGGAGDEIRTRALIQRSVTAEVQTPELIRALQGLEIKSIGYHQTNNFNGQTSPYMAARAVENAIRRALT